MGAERYRAAFAAAATQGAAGQRPEAGEPAAIVAAVAQAAAAAVAAAVALLNGLLLHRAADGLR